MSKQADRELEARIKRQTKRLQQAERDRPTLIGLTVYAGSLGLLLVLPIVGGAWLGRWIDGFASGYSVRWTISLIVVGVAVGAINVYLFIRE